MPAATIRSRAPPAARSRIRAGLADAKPERGIFTLYSACIGQTALDRLGGNDTANNSVFTRIFAEQMKLVELHLGDLAVEVRERVAELALKATDERGQPAPHEQTPAYYDQTLGGRIYLAGSSTVSRPAELAAISVPAAGGSQCSRAGCGEIATSIRTGRKLCAQRPRAFCFSSVLKPQFGTPMARKTCFKGTEPAAHGWRAGKAMASANGSRSSSRACAWCCWIVVRNGTRRETHLGEEQPRRHLRAVFSEGQTRMLTLQDRSGSESLTLPRPVKAYWVKFIIDDVWAGNKYVDSAITKLLVNSEPAQ